ncbi:proton-conducting transporter membrane subunit [Kitasatospora sp. KL5]|uniref:proton-conducting transporter transmembrane domain-containing protein n=1 Tax=Kitasatospora sp. KL5 TaxID=3425125 RepID=UPI003D6E0612
MNDWLIGAALASVVVAATVAVLTRDPARQAVVLAALGLGLAGALMCWQQRHLKRLLAFSTISHVGLFLVGIALLTPHGLTGTAVYVAGHGLAKAALFGLTGALLDRFGSVDEHGLYGRARAMRPTGVLFVVGALALTGLPPFGTGLGKAPTEEDAGHWLPWLPAVFVVASAAPGAAVLRAALRIFWGAGPAPQAGPGEEEITGEGEEPEIRAAERPLPPAMLAVPGVLLLLALLLGSLPAVVPALAHGAAAFTDPEAYRAAVTAGTATVSHAEESAWWAAPGLALGCLPAGLAVALALFTVSRRPDPRPALRPAERAVRGLRRLHSGHLGDYLAWLALGIAVLCAAVAAQS